MGKEALRKMKPILFNTDMVKAILEGRKTMTRRVVKPQPQSPVDYSCGKWIVSHPYAEVPTSQPPCQTGDILYVRETWCDQSGNGWPYIYKADLPMHWDAEETENGLPVDIREEDFKWRPSIHMPKEAARIFLRVTDVRTRPLQYIRNIEVVQEGIQPENLRPGGCRCSEYTEGCMEQDCPNREAYERECYIVPFIRLWNKTMPRHPNKFKRYPYYWEDNPLVWVIEFEKIDSETAWREAW